VEKEMTFSCYKPHYEGSSLARISGLLRFGINDYQEYFDGEKEKDVLLPRQDLKGTMLKKPYLQSPIRERVITTHRQLINKLRSLPTRSGAFFTDPVAMSNLKPTLKQVAPTKAEEKNMKPITVLEMITLNERIFGGCYIDLTIVDDPELKSGWIQVVAEDDNGDVARVFISIYDRTKESIEGKLEFGCRIRVLNPYFKGTYIERFTGIRVVEPKCIVYLKGVQNMCRFCGKENAKECKCSKCGRAYCSQDCLELDKSKMLHELICFSV